MLILRELLSLCRKVGLAIKTSPLKVRWNYQDTYIDVLNKHNIPIKEAILFGSYATGKYKEWSDIDIALVSDLFAGDRIDDKDKIRMITLSVSSEIEVLPFTPSDFTAQNPFVKEILKTGIKLI